MFAYTHVNVYGGVTKPGKVRNSRRPQMVKESCRGLHVLEARPAPALRQPWFLANEN